MKPPTWLSVESASVKIHGVNKPGVGEYAGVCRLLTTPSSANNIGYHFLGTEGTFACREHATEERIHGHERLSLEEGTVF